MPGDAGSPALVEMARVLDTPPEPAAATLADGVVSVTRAWRHGALHDRVAPMTDHVFMTYLGGVQTIERRSEGRIARAWTRPGAVTLIPARSEARWDIGGSISVVHAYVNPAGLSDYARRHGLPDAVPTEPMAENDETGSRILSLLAEAAAGPSTADRLFAEEAAALLCAHLLRSHCGRSAPLPAHGGLAPWQLKCVMNHLQDHLADDVSLAELAALVGLSSYHLCRAFKASTGLPPHRWRLARRIERARELLEHSEISITDVAAAVGYEDPSQLAAVFRKTLGMSPTRYRRERRS